MNEENTRWTAEAVEEMARSYRLPLAFLTAVRVGVIDSLLAGPATAGDLAASCKVDRDSLERLLNLLVSVGLLVRNAGAYALAPDAESAIGGRLIEGLRHTADGLDKWLALRSVLESGRAEFDDDLDVTLDPDRNEHFIRAMHAFAGPVAARFARIVPRRDARTFLDLGGGPGTFCFALLESWPGLDAWLADLPLTLRVTRRIAGERGLASRLHLVEADFYRDRSSNLGGPYDLVLVSAVLHAEGEEENRDLLGRVRRIVAPGGRIVIRENLLAEDRTSPERAALFDVHMLVSTRRGRCYTLSEVGSMLEGAGFAGPRLLSDLSEGFVVADA